MKRKKFIVMEEWDGLVEKVNPKTFVARLQNTKETVEEIATIYKRALSEEEQKHIQPGRLFKWKIGYYKDTLNGLESVIEFDKRVWTKAELDKASKEAERIFKTIQWE